jgi:hypothetical protein
VHGHAGKRGGYELRCMQQTSSCRNHVSGELGAMDWIFSCLSLHANGQLAMTGYPLDPVHWNDSTLRRYLKSLQCQARPLDEQWSLI